MVLTLRAPSRNSRTINFCVNIMFVRKILSPNLSWYLNKISTSQALLSSKLGFLGHSFFKTHKKNTKLKKQHLKKTKPSKKEL